MKFRFHRELIPDGQWEARCNELGDQQWNLFFMVWKEEQAAWMCFFRRALTTRESLAEKFGIAAERELPKERAAMEGMSAQEQVQYLSGRYQSAAPPPNRPEEDARG